MLRYITITLLLININNNISAQPSNNENYQVIGSNTIEKLCFRTSSSYSKNHEGNKAIDSDRDSSWVSGKEGPHWIEIDFGSKRIMTKIIIYPGKKDNYDTVRRVNLQFMYKNDWFDFASISLEDENSWSIFSDQKSIKERAVIDLGGIDASRFRLYIPEDATLNGYAAIAEIEAYVGSYRLKYYDERLKGLTFPVKNGYLPESNSRYPNAPRKYRGGTHVGVDILYYHTDDSYDPVPVNRETEILTVKNGTVIRADRDYTPMTVQEWKNQSEYYKTHPRTFVKRSFGGIQVWIDHGDGIVTTYNHLSKIDDDIKIGTEVEAGERIGWAGNSGLMGEAEGKDYGIHLHFEIWIDGQYFGKGMKIEDIKRYLTWIFSNY